LNRQTTDTAADMEEFVMGNMHHIKAGVLETKTPKFSNKNKYWILALSNNLIIKNKYIDLTSKINVRKY